MTGSHDGDAAAIRALVDEMNDAYARHDVESVASCFSQDIVALPPDMEPVVGIDQWRKLLSQFLAGSKPSQVEGTIDEITVAGDWAFDRHTAAATYTSAESDESERMFFKGIHVFRREADGWKIARYVWNQTDSQE